MEKSIIWRGILAGALAGVLGFIWSKIFIEPIVGRAIDFEDGTAAAHEAMATASGHGHGHGHEEGGELFTRAVQSNIGMGLGVLAFSVALGALFAVVFCVAYSRISNVSARKLAVLIAGGDARRTVGGSRAQVPAQPAGDQPRRNHQAARAALSADGGAVGAVDGRRRLPRLPAHAETGCLERDSGGGRRLHRRGRDRDADPADDRRDARPDGQRRRDDRVPGLPRGRPVRVPVVCAWHPGDRLDDDRSARCGHAVPAARQQGSGSPSLRE